jgi:hypothetical protein
MSHWSSPVFDSWTVVQEHISVNETEKLDVSGKFSFVLRFPQYLIKAILEGALARITRVNVLLLCPKASK